MNTNVKHLAKAGTLLLLDEGEYSDYSVIGFFVVLKDFYPLNELEEYHIQNPNLNINYSFSTGSFLHLLISKGYLLELEYGNLYLGSYGSSESTYFTLNK